MKYFFGESNEYNFKFKVEYKQDADEDNPTDPLAKVKAR